MIIFKAIRWRNFFNTGNYWQEVPLNTAQNTLILGKNGVGKSVLLDALCFSMFGKAFRKVNKPTITNSINKKEALVELEFSINQTEYKIRRGLAPALFEIYVDGVHKKQDTSTDDYQDYLEKFILKFNMKSFTQIVVLGSASYVAFMELKEADRRAIVEDLLDIQIFGTMHSITKERLKDTKEKISKIKLKLDSSKQKQVMQESYIADLQKNREEVLAEYQKDIDKKQEEISKLSHSIAMLTELIEDDQKRVVNKSKTEEDIKKLTKLEVKLESTIQKHKEHSTFFESSNTCPTCTQEIDEVFKQGKLSTLTEKTNKCEDGLKELQAQLTRKEQRLSEFKMIESDIRRNQVDRITQQTQLDGFRTSIVAITRKMTEIQNRAEGTTKEEAQLQEILQEIETADTLQKSLFEEKNYLDAASTILQDSGIKTKIIKQYIPIINSVCNKYLASLDFFVNFHLDENFNETIKSRYRDEFVYNSFSEGQKKRISMSLMLTWREIAKLKNSVDTNLLILDETFDSSLDSDGSDELMKILHLLKDNNVFVISHRGDILRDKFLHTIRFVLRQDFSYIET